jgi:glutamate-ammonia-ligase adenylyltransferase
LGGEELNYSSDVDLISVYENDVGLTSGVPNPSGIMFNKINNHEFFCKVTELFSKILSAQTEDGIAYRVDLRLRPQGQKGDIALPVKSCQTYYESWGRTWERMALIRARPVAGDQNLGKTFMERIRPFVWRETLDFTEVEEIRGLKKRIDSTLSRDDIKRGYGGIREAEFFIQTFQLLYMGKNSSLKSYRILNAIQALKWMKIIPEEDLTTLWENYLFLRRIEQYLQMKEDLQTHALPVSDHDMNALARLMGVHSTDDFLADLRLRRMQIKSMYNSLLGTREDVHSEALNLLEAKLSNEELSGYLSFRRVKDPQKCLVKMKSIREHMSMFQTRHERSITREALPRFLEDSLSAESPDRALAGLENLLSTYGIKTVHLTAVLEVKELMTGIVKMFSLSPYLTRIFLSSHYYLNILIEEWAIFKTLKTIEKQLGKTLGGNEDFNSRLARFKRLEEVRLGMLFLQKILKTEDLFRDLSYLAEAIIKSITEKHISNGLSVIALGKLGGREMTFGSDLDIIFVSETAEAAMAAEKIMKSLTSYSDMGLLYSVDTRLRPDGSKGILVKDIEGYRNYYLNSAQNWEIQALLKARPVGGDEKLGWSFMNMAKDLILQKGSSTQRDNIAEMRERIIKELSHESAGLDIKLGPGGIEEIEFFVQFLQLHHAQRFPDILVQNTPAAINRLAKNEILDKSGRDTLFDAYRYFRKLETFLRLNEERVLAKDSVATQLLVKFMEYKGKGEFTASITNLRDNVLKVINQD